MAAFDPNQRIGVHKVALTFLEKFQWIEREQAISDFGIDMLIEISIEGKPTGQLVALQIKTGSSYFGRDENECFVFDKGEMRHLEYWVDQAIPVLLVLVNLDCDLIIWEHVQWSKVTQTGIGWKICVPKANKLPTSKDQILKIYFDEGAFRHLGDSDMSTGTTRRIDSRYRVERQFCQSRVVLRNMIPRFVDKQKNNQYYRDQLTRETFQQKENVDVVVIFFYHNKREADYGFAFCIVVWNNPSLPIEDQFIPSDFSERIGEIGIIWEPRVYLFDDVVTVSTENFLNFLEDMTDQLITWYHRFKSLGSQLEMDSNLDGYKIGIESIDLASIGNQIAQLGLPPENCERIATEINNAFFKLNFLKHLVTKDNHYPIDLIKASASRLLLEFEIHIEQLEKLKQEL